MPGEIAKHRRGISRRELLRRTGQTVLAATSFNFCKSLSVVGADSMPRLIMRPLGRTGRQVSTLGLGGGASIMFPNEGIDSVEIIVKAIKMNVTYLDTANNYGVSQTRYHQAFEKLNLIPGRPGYDEALRSKLFVNSKSALRYGLIRDGSKPMGRSEGQGSTAIDDLRRALTQIFGDGKGAIPEGAYLDCLQIHNLTKDEEVDAIYEGYDTSNSSLPRVGAIAALLDYRDGTNHTGCNPERKRYICHIGITGHLNAAAHMYAIQRDSKNVLDTLLVAINPNDKNCLNHQYNSIAVAHAKGMGVIGMKVFADGVFYGRPKVYGGQAPDSVPTVGQAGKVTPQEFIQYSLSVPGVSTVIIGIGVIDPSNDPTKDQLIANLMAAQLKKPLTQDQRLDIETRVARLHGTDTNFFQRPKLGLTPPRHLTLRKAEDGSLEIRWMTSYTGDHPISRYEIFRGEDKIGSVAHRPQISLEPFKFVDKKIRVGSTPGNLNYRVRTVDSSGAFEDSESFPLSAVLENQGHYPSVASAWNRDAFETSGLDVESLAG